MSPRWLGGAALPPTGWAAWALLLVAGCSDPEPSTFQRSVVDCTDDDEQCRVPDTGCSIRVAGPALDGGVSGGCGDAGERRTCTKLCEDVAECPEGFECRAASDCPGTQVRYCVPTGAELTAQGLAGCGAVADPRVCGFF